MTSTRELVHVFMERCPLALACGLGLVVWLGLPGSGQAAEEPVRVCSPTGDFLTYEDLIDCAINPEGDLDVFEFFGRDGETVRIEIAELIGTGNACIELFDPDGRRLGSSCFGNRIDATLPEDGDGTYTIVVSEDGSNATVRYRLSLERLTPPSPTARPLRYGRQVEDEINPRMDMDLFFIRGNAGDTIRIQVVEVTGPGNACIELFDPDGRRLGSSCFGNRIDATLPEDGTYTIVVSENGNSTTVQYRLSVQCIRGGSNGCPVTPIPDVTGCVHFMGAPLVNRSVDLLQTDEPPQRTRTDTRGYYKFNQAVSGKPFRVILRGPAVP